MSSPFPGMDPYLERYWGDVHQAFLTYARDAIQARLPRNLRARMQERVFVETDFFTSPEFYPDVHIYERPGNTAEARAETGGVAIADALVFEFPQEPITEGYIEIRDAASGNRVVTSIEVLSPSNKRRGEGRRSFRQKERTLRTGGANLVEIDLLRGGKRAFAISAERLPQPWRSSYLVCVWRATRRDRIEFYRAPVRSRLPAIPIPLRPVDPDLRLDLQAIIDQCYRNGGYEDIDYRAGPEPPFSAEDATWADQLLQEQGRR